MLMKRILGHNDAFANKKNAYLEPIEGSLNRRL